MTVAGQPTINYAYDNANRLIQITQGSSVVGFGYDAAGRRSSLTLPNGILVEYAYDAASRVTGINYKQGITVLGNLAYEYDKAGNRTKVAGSFARTGIPQSVSSTNYNAANQQTTFGDKTLTYDNNGNLTSITDASGTTFYTWNARNQLTGISGPGVNATFVYDGLGRREKKTINGSLTEFLYDGVNPVQETSGAAVLANILSGFAIDEHFARTEVGSGTTSTFLGGTLGSTLALADSNGAIQTEYTYEPFGNSTSTGMMNGNPFQYTGRESDGGGLYYYRMRYYHSRLQRFVSEDPLPPRRSRSQMMNLYGYVENNPLFWTDPLGLDVWICQRPVDLPWPWDLVPHYYIKTGTYQSGMGEAGGRLPGGNYRNPITNNIQTETVDHTGQGGQCTPMKDVDEDCVNNLIRPGQPLGRWTPFNQCMNFATDVIMKCLK